MTSSVYLNPLLKNPDTDELQKSKHLYEETLASGTNTPVFLQLGPKDLENPESNFTIITM